MTASFVIPTLATLALMVFSALRESMKEGGRS